MVSTALRVSADWAWRFVVVVAAVGVCGWILRPVRSIIIALAVALLLAVLLTPLVGWLKRRLGWGKSAAAAVGLLVGAVLVGGLLALAVDQLIRKSGPLVTETLEGMDQALNWIATGPLGSESVEFSEFVNDFQTDMLAFFREHSGTIASGAWAVASGAAGWISSALIAIFALFFFLRDGRSMWVWFVRCLPKASRVPVDEAAIRGWVTLTNYVRTQSQVAAIDAIGIGLGALILGVPLAIPIMVLVFFGSFIPIVGAFVTGGVAIFIALVNNGLTSAIIMLVIVLAVQQIEGNVLQPWLMSQAVSLHPVAVVLAVAVGGVVSGISGAIFAVPIVAFINVVMLYWHGHDPLPWLATDKKRPGGAPGTLSAQIEASYANPKKVRRR